MDFKLFISRFFEYSHMTHSVQEIHDFVNQLIESEFVKDRFSRVRLIRSLLQTFKGLEGIDDEIILFGILNIILKRFIPEDDDKTVEQFESGAAFKEWKLQNDFMKEELRNWQSVMFEAEVPQMLIHFLNI